MTDQATPESSVTLIDLEHRIGQAWLTGHDYAAQEAALAMEGKAVCREFIKVGEAYQARESLVLRTPQEIAHDRFYLFEWPLGAKRFMLLWRNILLEWEKAVVHLKEGQAKKSELAKLHSDGKEALIAAARHWFYESEQRRTELDTDLTIRDQQLYSWSLQDSPWESYRKQFAQIIKQINLLHQDFAIRVAAADTFILLQQELLGLSPKLADNFEELKARAERARKILEIDSFDEEEEDDVFSKLEGLDPVDMQTSSIEELSANSNAIIDRLPDAAKLYVATPQGKLQYRDIALEKLTGQWVSAEVMPSLQRGIRNLEQASLDLSRTLLDARSQLRLAREIASAPPAEGEESKAEPLRPEDLQVSLSNYLERLELSAQKTLIELRENDQIVADQLRLSRVYDPTAGFLEVSFEAGISQVRRTQDALVNRFAEWLSIQRKTLTRLRHRVSEEEALSEGERIVRVLRTRRADPANAPYNSVVATRGFIGEAFHAGREYEIARAKNAIDAFHEGFRGTIAVTGQRYSGRSHFIELIAGRYFEQKTVRLLPNAVVEVAGRTQQTTCDLGAAIAFVRKHSVGRQLLVVVEDLELWSDETHRIGANAQALRQALDELSGRMMFIVSMGNWTFRRLDHASGLSAAFQVEINMDQMLLEDFTKTVLIRHSATHHVMVDENGKELSEGALREYAREVCRAARGNVGDALRRWAQGVYRVGVARVGLRRKINYSLPNFIDADTGAVLSAIKCKRYANERGLRKLFGPAFSRQYRLVVLRLLRLDILLRHRSGTLSINPVVSNEIGRLLERDDYLQAAYSRTPIQL